MAKVELIIDEATGKEYDGPQPVKPGFGLGFAPQQHQSNKKARNRAKNRVARKSRRKNR